MHYYCTIEYSCKSHWDRTLGWCSWDAFYTEVNETGLREKTLELKEKQVPVRWMLIDDGWLQIRDRKLWDFQPDPEKFPHGFSSLTRDLQTQTEIRWFGVWHTLCGYWGGIHPDGPVARALTSCLVRNPNGSLVPDPANGAEFYRRWYDHLRRQGISFVKVDDQSSVSLFFENSRSVCEATEGLNRALEMGASSLDLAVINCMGMAMENMFSRHASAVARNSDDFFPRKEESFSEHLLQNAYNSLYHDELYCCDWDMFWTLHTHARKHSLLRAISGGPVYFSDRTGDTVPEVLRPLTYTDGRILMLDRSARPTEDCVFRDPRKDGVLKLHNTGPWGACLRAGGVAVFNLTNQRQEYTVSPAEIPGLSASDQYWAYDWFERKVILIGREEHVTGALDPDGYAWHVFLPRTKYGSCLGLADKYAGFTAVESMQDGEQGTVVVLREGGPTGWVSACRPERVLDGLEDVTDQVQTFSDLYLLPLPERPEKTVLTITWKRSGQP